jgi:Ca2+-binding EF-hand superfamily protein
MSSNKLNRFIGFAAGVVGLCGFVVPRVAFANDAETKFESMDTNNDGKISQDEFTAASSRMFDKMDTNKDGKVTAAEMTAAHQQITGKKAEKGELNATDKIKKFDTNGDGVLSADEHEAASRTMFEKMDTDHDGHLTKAELKAGHEKYLQKTAK